MGKLSPQSTQYVLTANDLRSGAIVYRCHSGWTDRFEDALLYGTEQTDCALVLAAEQEVACVVIGSYLIEVQQRDSVPLPLKLRESQRLSSQQRYAPAALGGAA